MVLDGAIHGANGPGEGGLPPPDSFMVCAAAAGCLPMAAAVRDQLSGDGGVTQARTAGAMDGAYEPPWMG